MVSMQSSSASDLIIQCKKKEKEGEGGADTGGLPGLKLLQFFENMVQGGEGKSKIFETSKSTAISQALSVCQPFCEEWAKKNLKVWKEGGFM